VSGAAPVLRGGEVLSAAFARVLRLLREADMSGAWPQCSSGRKEIISQATADAGGGSFSVGSMPPPLRVPAGKGLYEGRKGVVEGTYTNVCEGKLPYRNHTCNPKAALKEPPFSRVPAANALFPELTAAAFQLEAVLVPGREGSSTIAVNRRAQFRPHYDSGGGAGQSTSLIVGLGDYQGGEVRSLRG
jgi:hypothetical protein